MKEKKGAVPLVRKPRSPRPPNVRAPMPKQPLNKCDICLGSGELYRDNPGGEPVPLTCWGCKGSGQDHDDGPPAPPLATAPRGGIKYPTVGHAMRAACPDCGGRGTVSLDSNGHVTTLQCGECSPRQTKAIAPRPKVVLCIRCSGKGIMVTRSGTATCNKCQGTGRG